ncbi:MAG: NAD(+) diphosphatase [Ruminococcus sp.]|nr:NAD(+) diphosphatase [Ruminococcus sp.]
MIQEIGTDRLDNSYSPDIAPSAGDTLFCFRDNDVLASDDMTAPFPRTGEVRHSGEPLYLFSIGSRRYFLTLDETATAPERYSYANVRQLRRCPDADKAELFAMFTAYHLYKWYSSGRFCGVCGAPTAHDTKERALRCTECGYIVYPRISPAVIVGVTNGDKLLLTRYAKGRGVAFDALVAGFTEIGETLEQTVEREVMEEVGLRVKNIRYYKSQPWGLSGTILAGFYCDVDGDDTITLDESELSAAVWTSRADIVGQPDDMSLTNEMMKNFRDGKV